MNSIIYGCGVTGQAIYQECAKKGLRIMCFCDDSAIVKQHSSFDIPILTLNEIKEQYIDSDIEFYIAIPDAKGIVTKLKKNGFVNWKLSYEILYDNDFENYIYSKNKVVALHEIKSCMLSHHYYEKKDSIFMRNVDIVITEKCSLKCKDCSNLMQYYQHPRNFSLSSITYSIDTLFKYVDEIYEFRLLGGEPLLNKEIYNMLDIMISYEKLHRILILTNGTIVPPEEYWNTLRSNKIEFIITDYGKLSSKIKDLEKMLIENNIGYNLQKAYGWMSCSSIEKHNRSEQELMFTYDNCCAKNLVTLLNNKLFKCPYMANADNLHAICGNENDYIDLSYLNNLAINDAKSIISNFLFEKNYFNSCDYCTGRSYGADEIEPAIQIDKPLIYSNNASVNQSK